MLVGPRATDRYAESYVECMTDDDDSAMRSLQARHYALGERENVLIVDRVVPTGNKPHYGKLLDLEMLVLTPRGRERALAHVKATAVRSEAQTAGLLYT